MPKTAHELSRKEMKGPDRFQQAAAGAAGWLAERRNPVLIAVVAVAVVAVAAAVVNAVLDDRRERAGGLLYKALDAAGGEVSSVPLPNAGVPVYKSPQEKAQAVLAVTSELRARYGGTRAATTAALLEGDAQLSLADWDKAIAAFQGFLAGAPAGDSLRFAALDGLARARVGKGDLEGAAKAYEQASQVEGFKDRAVLERARVLARAGKGADAKKALEGLSAGSPLQPEAQALLGRVGGK